MGAQNSLVINSQAVIGDGRRDLIGSGALQWSQLDTVFKWGFAPWLEHNHLDPYPKKVQEQEKKRRTTKDFQSYGLKAKNHA